MFRCHKYFARYIYIYVCVYKQYELIGHQQNEQNGKLETFDAVGKLQTKMKLFIDFFPHR